MAPVKVLRGLVTLCSGAFVAMFLFVALGRVRWPHELAIDPWTSLHSVAPGWFGRRLCSIGATIVTAACIWRLSRTHGGTRFWAWAAIGVFFAGFALAGFTYDLERSEPICVALLILAAVVASESQGALGAALGGLLIGIACLVRQPALLFVVAAFLALLKTPARAFALLLAAAGVVVPIALWQRHWFGQYVSQVSISFRDPLSFARDVPRGFALVIATIAVVPTLWRKPSLFAALVFVSFVAAVVGRTMLYWLPFGCIAIALLASRIEGLLVGNLLARRGGELLCAVVLAQLALLAYDPRAQLPTLAIQTPLPPAGRTAAQEEVR